MIASLRIRLARWLLRGTGYHLRANRRGKSNVEPVQLVREGARVKVAKP